MTFPAGSAEPVIPASERFAVVGGIRADRTCVGCGSLCDFGGVRRAAEFRVRKVCPKCGIRMEIRAVGNSLVADVFDRHGERLAHQERSG